VEVSDKAEAQRTKDYFTQRPILNTPIDDGSCMGGCAATCRCACVSVVCRTLS
jgi:hypothetical protein